VAAEFAVGAGEEVVALGVVLADEQHVGRLGAAAEVGVAPPPGQVGVVAAEFVVVLVGAAGTVELQEEQPRLRPSVVGDLEGGVGDDWTGMWVAEPFDGPVVLEARLSLARFAGGVIWCSPCQSSSAGPSSRR
jgi:hypothetical protein